MLTTKSNFNKVVNTQKAVVDNAVYETLSLAHQHKDGNQLTKHNKVVDLVA